MIHSHTVRHTAAGIALTCLLVHGSGLATPPSAPVQEAVKTIQTRGDHRHAHFIVLDKVAARLWVFDADAHAVASSPVLLGAAVGDDSVPGIGTRPLGAIRMHERTTPAGRFRVEPGRNLEGEDIFWVDYDAAVSMHRMHATNPKERRAQRLASTTPSDNRITFGCINLPLAFYDDVIRPLFSNGRGWIYVLPETRPVRSLFAAGAT